MTQPSTLDPAHAAAVEAACALDRDYFEKHPKDTLYRRPGLDHELCPPGGPCEPVPEVVAVMKWADGVRMRFRALPLANEEARYKGPDDFRRQVHWERAVLAATDQDGEAEAVAPLSEVRSRQILLGINEDVDVSRRREMRRRTNVPTSERFDPRELLDAIGADPTRQAGVVRCPAHQDRRASLSWKLAGEKVLLHCFAGCTFDEIRAAVA